MSSIVVPIPEHIVPGKRLGRHREHDPRSLMFAVKHDGVPIVSTAWQRFCPPFDQGDLGSCCGNAAAGAMMSAPFYTASRLLTETDAVDLYSQATRLDKIPGHYPPSDTGSSGIAVCKALKNRGWIASYAHAFTLQQALAALMAGPVLLGIPWYEGFDVPLGQRAELIISGSVRGGHEIEALAVDVDAQLIRICNSWGASWGDGGYCVVSYDTLTQLLAEGGDVTCPQPSTPPPAPSTDPEVNPS